MQVFAAGQNARVTNRVAARTRQHVFAIESSQQALHLQISADLLEAELQVAEQFVELALIHIWEAGAPASAQPGAGQLEAELLEQVEEPGEVAAQGDAAIGAGDGLNHRSHGSARGFGNDAVELHVGENTVVVPLVDIGDGPPLALGQQGGQGAESVVITLEGGDVHQGGDRFFGGGGLADGVQAAGQQPAFDLHQLAIHRANHGVACIEIQVGGISLGQLNVFVEVALTRRFHHGVHNLHAAGTFTQLLIGAHQLAELLETLVKTSIFSWWGEVGNGFGVAAPLGDRGFRWVVGGVVVEVGKCSDQ